jgi:prepilin-type N-terminal cleavage/methylation domain-containing protein
MHSTPKEKGFTLIELLVVISIISLLSSIVLASLTLARARARDIRRVTDMKALQTALELYKATSGLPYPTAAQWANDGDGGITGGVSNFAYALRDLVVKKVISRIPDDPNWRAGVLNEVDQYGYANLDGSNSGDCDPFDPSAGTCYDNCGGVSQGYALVFSTEVAVFDLPRFQHWDHSVDNGYDPVYEYCIANP